MILIGSIGNYIFLTNRFYPVLNSMDSSVTENFRLKNANYEEGNISKYSLKFNGDESLFLDSCIEFSNMFYEAVSNDENAYGTYKLVFSCGKEYIKYWKTGASKSSYLCTIQTNILCDYSLFENFNGLYALSIDATEFTDEQISYVNGFSDQLSFDVSVGLNKSDLLY